MDEITAEQIAQHYTAMGHSVDLINAIIAGTADGKTMMPQTSRTVWTGMLSILKLWLLKSSGVLRI
jgi:hypothetical protein